MTDGQAKRLELLKKLKALADNGVGGERENAQAMLDKLLAKYDISAEALSDDEVSDHGFTYHSDFERRLLSQLRAKIATNRDAFRYKYGRAPEAHSTVPAPKPKPCKSRLSSSSTPLSGKRNRRHSSELSSRSIRFLILSPDAKRWSLMRKPLRAWVR